MNKVLEFKGVSKSYGGYKVLEDLSFSIEKGSIAALIGETGSGKSTIARLAVGLERPDKGEILLMGKSVELLKKRSFCDCASIQYIFQDAYGALEDGYTVEQILSEPIRICRRRGRKEIYSPEQALSMAGLGDYEYWKGMKAAALSGGQRQKLSIARALIPKPDILITDESTAMLDTKSSREVFEILREICIGHGLSVIAIIHQRHIIDNSCDKVMVLHEGRIVEEGPADIIMNFPSKDYTKELIACMNIFVGV